MLWACFIIMQCVFICLLIGYLKLANLCRRLKCAKVTSITRYIQFWFSNVLLLNQAEWQFNIYFFTLGLTWVNLLIFFLLHPSLFILNIYVVGLWVAWGNLPNSLVLSWQFFFMVVFVVFQLQTSLVLQYLSLSP